MSRNDSIEKYISAERWSSHPDPFTRQMWDYVIMAGHAEILPGWGMEHRNAGFLLQYTVRGNARVVTRNRVFSAGPGDLIFLDGHLPYEMNVKGEQPWKCEWAFFDSARGFRWLEALGCDRNPVVRIVRRAEMRELFRGVMRLIREKPSGYEAQLSALIQRIMALLFTQQAAAEAGSKRRDGARPAAAIPSSMPAAVRLAVSNIAQLFYQPTSVGKIAEKSGLGRTMLYTLFKRHLGFSPLECMNRYRIYYARELLQHTALPIKEIASQVGIQQESYFSRLFRQKTGRSPRQFRLESHTQAPTPLVDKPDPWKALQQMRVRGQGTERIRARNGKPQLAQSFSR